jgi:hypothetical protein
VFFLNLRVPVSKVGEVSSIKKIFNRIHDVMLSGMTVILPAEGVRSDRYLILKAGRCLKSFFDAVRDGSSSGLPESTFPGTCFSHSAGAAEKGVL